MGGRVLRSSAKSTVGKVQICIGKGAEFDGFTTFRPFPTPNRIIIASECILHGVVKRSTQFHEFRVDLNMFDMLHSRVLKTHPLEARLTAGVRKAASITGSAAGTAKRATTTGSKRGVLGDISNKLARVEPLKASKPSTAAVLEKAGEELPSTVRSYPGIVVLQVSPSPLEPSVSGQSCSMPVCSTTSSSQRDRMDVEVPSRLELMEVDSSRVISPRSVGKSDSKESTVVAPSISSEIGSHLAPEYHPYDYPEYTHDIYCLFRKYEEMFSITDYLPRQPGISELMRAVLMDWLVEVQENFELIHESLYLAAKIVDIFLMRCEIAKDQLQLLGATAIFIATKYEERHAPKLDDFIYICDYAYQPEEFKHMELRVLKTLHFQLFFPIPYRYLRPMAKIAGVNLKVLTMSRFIMELSMLEYDVVTQYRDSLISAACFYLALRMSDVNPPWMTQLAEHIGYTEEQLLPLSRRLNTMLLTPHKRLTTIRDKYSHEVFFKVASVLPLAEGTL